MKTHFMVSLWISLFSTLSIAQIVSTVPLSPHSLYVCVSGKDMSIILHEKNHMPTKDKGELSLISEFVGHTVFKTQLLRSTLICVERMLLN